MKTFPLFVASLCSLVSLTRSQGEENYYQGHKTFSSERPEHVVTPIPTSSPPDQWLWNDVNGRNYLTLSRNQHLPVWCGSCWAFAVTSSLSDRIKIQRKGAWPDINISPQALVSCAYGLGCNGGDPLWANKWMHLNNITDETCSIYQARDGGNGVPCSKLEICENCHVSGEDMTCWQPTFFHKYRVAEYGTIKGNDTETKQGNYATVIKNMMTEIYHRGPITCAIRVPQRLLNYTEGIFDDQTPGSHTHDISIVGYGIDKESGKNYWLIRNSWGTFWGEHGYLRLLKGVDSLGLESGAASGMCTWATPVNTWDDAEKEKQEAYAKKDEELSKEANVSSKEVTINEPFLDKLYKLVLDFIEHKSRPKPHIVLNMEGCLKKNSDWVDSNSDPRPQDYIRDEDVPEEWDWRNMSGVNYLSWSVNQHIPSYCGSCWAQGSASAIADRFIIADPKKYANLALSAQYIVQCSGAGSCNGGDPFQVNRFAADHGLVEETCNTYMANTGPELCYECRTCSPPRPKNASDTGHCADIPRKQYKKYRLKNFGRVSGASDMKKEIYARGPIACGVMADQKFLNYRGGIYSDPTDSYFCNHEISVVGWGKDKATGMEYWIGRNSWGTYWGEYGYFRIQMYKNNINIESECAWAEPLLNVH